MILVEITRYSSPLIVIEVLKWVVYTVVVLARKVNERVAVVVYAPHPASPSASPSAKSTISRSATPNLMPGVVARVSSSLHAVAVMVEVCDPNQ